MKDIKRWLKFGLSFGISAFVIFHILNLALNARSWTGNLTWNNKDTVTSTKRNQLLTKLNTAIWRSWPDWLTAGSWEKLTTTKWNWLVSKVNTYANSPTCTNDNGWNCNITAASKSALEPNLVAWNISSWISIFGVSGTLTSKHVYCRAIYGWTVTSYCEVWTSCYSRNGYHSDAYYTIYVSTSPTSIICWHTRWDAYQQYVYTSPWQFFSRGTVCQCYTTS